MAGRLESFEAFFASQVSQLNLITVSISILLAALLSYLLGVLYLKYGTSLSNRQKFASNFVLLSTTTTLIITIVKSSLALSLGLVGALSIVRFRAAIKEPEELAFLFLAIAIGLGAGADQWKVTIVSFLIISLLIFGRHKNKKKEDNHNLYLIISGKESDKFDLNKIIEIIKKNSSALQLKRFDKLEDNFIEVAFSVDFKSFDCLNKAKKDLELISKNIKISYLDKIEVY